jgi:glycopeptide antibiotics resistance protein
MSMKRDFTFKRWLPFLFCLYSLLLVSTSLIPMDAGQHGGSFLSSLEPGVQNILHIPMMAVFSFLLLSGFECFAEFPKKGLLLGIGVSVAFALLLELVQVFVPGRYPSFMDMVLNVAGIGLGIAANGLFLRWKSFWSTNERK